MKKPQATQVLGVLAVLGGAWILWFSVVTLCTLWGGKSPWIFVLLLLTAITAVGGTVIYSGVQLIKHRSPPLTIGSTTVLQDERWRAEILVDPVVHCVRYLLALVAGIGIFAIAAYGEKFALKYFPEEIARSVNILVGVALVLPLYVVAVRYFMRSRGYVKLELRYVLGRLAVLLLAFAIYQVFYDGTQWLVADKKPEVGDTVVGENAAWELGLALGPVLLAMMFYRVALHLLRFRENELAARRVGMPGTRRSEQSSETS